MSLVHPGAWLEGFPEYARVDLYASKAGVGGSRVADCEIDDGEKLLTFVLLPRCPVAGTVVDSGGLPVCGARVQLQTRHWPEPPDGRDPRIPPEAVSDCDGSFRLEIDSTCDFTIQARLGQQETDTWTLSGSEGEPLSLTLRFPGPYAIEGSLGDAMGRPLRGTDVIACDVRCWTDEAAQPTDGSFRAGSEADGTFVIHLPRPGRYVLAGLTEDRFLIQPVYVDIDERSPRATASLRLLEGAFIAGRVRWSSGEPVGDGWVEAEEAEPRESPLSPVGWAYWWRPANTHATIEGDGSFRVGPLPPGKAYRLRCGLPSSDRALASRGGILAGTEGLEIALPFDSGQRAFASVVVHPPSAVEPTEWIYGDLLGYEPGPDGEPSNEDASLRPLFKEPDRFRIEDLIPGRSYALRLWSDEGEALVEPWIATLPGVELDVQLRAYGEVEVEVVDDSGQAVPFADVEPTATRRHPLTFSAGQWEIQTDEAGYGRDWRVAPGTYELRARKRGVTSEATSIEVLPGQTVRARLALPTRASARSRRACRGRS